MTIKSANWHAKPEPVIAKTKISNLQFIATLIHLGSIGSAPFNRDENGVPHKWISGHISFLTYTSLMEYFHTWRGKSTHVTNWKGQTRRNHWGCQYLSFAPFHGGSYKHVLWTSRSVYQGNSPYTGKDKYRKQYILLPRAKRYIVPATDIDDLMKNYEHKSS